MKLQDYAHYYLGCKVAKDSDALDYPILKGIHGDRVMVSEYRYKTPNCDGVFTRPEMYHYVGFVKPILRRLQDMTRDEMRAIWMIIFSREFRENGRIEWHEKETHSSCKRWCMISGVERVGIELNGNVWADSGLSNYKFNPHLITHYLLTQHFDLFGLIDTGLAIDAQTINQ
jgi:hypothetical protein